MVVFDTDAVSEVLRRNPTFVDRLAAIPASHQAVTVVTVEELMRGRLAKIREAQGRRDPTALVRAYGRLAETVEALRPVRILRDDTRAEDLISAWQAGRIRVRPADLRIAAITHVAGAVLVTRNRRDFELVPGLRCEFWT